MIVARDSNYADKTFETTIPTKIINYFALQPLFEVAPPIVLRSLIKWSFLSPDE